VKTIFSEMEVSYMRRETKQEINEIEEMPNENEYPTIEDTEDAREKLKNNRSPGPDNMISELFKITQKVRVYNSP
jgi:hypothetical protein